MQNWQHSHYGQKDGGAKVTGVDFTPDLFQIKGGRVFAEADSIEWNV
jgi:hypothetical protein